jgi:hypothetical protein
MDGKAKQLSGQEYQTLAKLLLKRFGSPEQATYAWQRMMQNSITVGDFMEILDGTY